ncbi:MAG: dTDP-N-acetylfucosamine:lipid II N-acetylfucosaminyltransferase [Gammaproteobacteria bacterium]|jgi:dTDP-N-acetylfucosamine:lipid II N-acetylfucosaminyltransferase
MKYLHVFNNEVKFSKDFLHFMKENSIDLENHELFQYSEPDLDYQLIGLRNLFFSSWFSITGFFVLCFRLHLNDRIMLHNLASPALLLNLFLFPALIKKCYWHIWGKDLYYFQLLPKKYFHHHIYEYFRKFVFKRVKHVVTYVKGDFDLAKEWYQVDAEYHHCLMYPSNLFKCLKEKRIERFSKKVKILVGNSSDSGNNHESIFKAISPYKEQDIELICPLSYGDTKNAQKVLKLGQQIFGNKFKPLVSFIPSDDYLNMLNELHIAFFAHHRQQGMGNLISLLSMGKKVYLKKNTTSFRLFSEIGLVVYDSSKFNLVKLSDNEANNNRQIAASYFSQENYLSQLKSLYVNS